MPRHGGGQRLQGTGGGWCVGWLGRGKVASKTRKLGHCGRSFLPGSAEQGGRGEGKNCSCFWKDAWGSPGACSVGNGRWW